MVPRIRMLSFLEGAEAATGACVVIDVFRAFSLVPWALMGGARMVVPVRTEAEALAWKRRDPTVLLAGERDGKPLPGFDFGNSPSEIRRADLAGRVLIHRTSAGTQGLLAALEAGAFPVLAGSFLTAGATIRYLKSLELSELSIVAMTFAGFALLYILFSRIFPYVPVWEIKEGRLRYTMVRIGRLLVPTAAELD